MLTEFYLDEDFFSSDFLKDEYMSAVHDFVLNNWRNHGILILPKSKAVKLLDCVKQLPPKFHQRWNAAIADNYRFMSTDDWEDFNHYADFNAALPLASYFKTGLTEDIVGLKMNGGNECKISCPHSGFEVLGAGVSSESQNFDRSRILSSKDIPPRANIDDIWVERLEIFAKYSKSITIIDRYFLERVLNDFQRGKNNTSFINFMRLAARSGNKYDIKIISDGGAKGEKKCSDICEYFYSRIASSPPIRKAISSLTIVSNDVDYFQRFSHERFIAFDHHVCKIGVGMQIFENYEIPLTDFSAQVKNQTRFYERESNSDRTKLWCNTFIK